MKTKHLLILIGIISITGCSKKQEVIFEGNSISYRNSEKFSVSDMEKECGEISKELSQYLKDGWKVVTSSPKEIPVARNRGKCVGTEYIIEK